MSFLAACYYWEWGADLQRRPQLLSSNSKHTTRFSKGGAAETRAVTLNELSVWSAQSFRKVVDVFFLVKWILTKENVNKNHEFPTVRENKKIVKMQKISVILTCVALFGQFVWASSCPESCKCANEGAIVDCSRQGLTRIPANLPRNTITL